MSRKKWVIRIGERVSFGIKKEDGLHMLEGKIAESLSSTVAKDKGILSSKKTGRVLVIEGDDGQVYHKFKSVCRQVVQK